MPARSTVLAVAPRAPGSRTNARDRRLGAARGARRAPLPPGVAAPVRWRRAPRGGPRSAAASRPPPSASGTGHRAPARGCGCRLRFGSEAHGARSGSPGKLPRLLAQHPESLAGGALGAAPPGGACGVVGAAAAPTFAVALGRRDTEGHVDVAGGGEFGARGRLCAAAEPGAEPDIIFWTHSSFPSEKLLEMDSGRVPPARAPRPLALPPCPAWLPACVHPQGSPWSWGPSPLGAEV